MRAYFLQRLAAFIIDVLVVSVLVSLVLFFLPGNNALKKAEKDYLNAFSNIMKGTTSAEEGNKIINDSSYVMAKEGVPQDICKAIVYLLYFVWYQVYNNGQTVGKKLLKIKVKKKNDDALSYNDLLKREVILYSIWIDIAMIILVSTLSRSDYINIANNLSLIQTLIIVSIALSVLFRKDGKGIHDLVTNTEVVIVREEIVSEIVEAQIIDERSDNDERVNRTGNSKKRKTKGDK